METNLKENPPYSVAVLVLGICSIVVSGGLICGIIALVLARNGLKQFNSAPELYKNNSLLRAGQICAIIGVSLRAIAIILVIIFVVFVWSAGNFHWYGCGMDNDAFRHCMYEFFDIMN
ncbi:MAG: hypothetical protein LBL74_01800 [Bacteroidales bacterium]|jgi:hypothetical protein|nr:hypothetical protein [Bacteroidales bacterium]